MNNLKVGIVTLQDSCGGYLVFSNNKIKLIGDMYHGIPADG